MAVDPNMLRSMLMNGINTDDSGGMAGGDANMMPAAAMPEPDPSTGGAMGAVPSPTAPSPGPPPVGASLPAAVQPTGAAPQKAPPGFMKGMLMDFMGNFREALQKEMGIETDTERKTSFMKQQQQILQAKNEAMFKAAQVAHMGAQTEQANRDLEFRKAQADVTNAAKQRELDIAQQKADKEAKFNPSESSLQWKAVNDPDPKQRADAHLALKNMHDEHVQTALASRQPKDTSAAQANLLQRSDQYHTTALDKLAAPLDSFNQRADRLRATLDQPNLTTDALASPELMTVIAGGQGSGLRLNEAEIKRVAGSQDKYDQFKAALSQWGLAAPGQKVTIQPEQRANFKRILTEVQRQVQAKQNSINDAREAIAGSNDVSEHKHIYAKVRRSISGGSTAPANTGGWRGNPNVVPVP